MTSKLTLIRVLYGFLVDRPFQAIYQDEQLAPNLKLITWLTSLYAREGARTLKIYIYLSFDCKTCYCAFNGSQQFKNILNGSWQYILFFSINVYKFIHIFEDGLGHVLKHLSCVLLERCNENLVCTPYLLYP